jgi:hypothetical protein
MFLDSGEETAPVDVMHHAWTGSWPTNQCPRLEGIWLDGKTAPQNIRLTPGQTYAAKVAASDPDEDSLTFHWEVLEESTSTNVGGDAEHRPPQVPGLITDPSQAGISLKAPVKPGAYRLFAYVYDGQDHAAHANIPFQVEEASKLQRASAQPAQP